jgi:hypothetical protein
MRAECAHWAVRGFGCCVVGSAAHRPSISTCSSPRGSSVASIRCPVRRRRRNGPRDPPRSGDLTGRAPSDGSAPQWGWLDGSLYRHDGMAGGVLGAENSRSLRGLAASSSQAMMSRSSFTVGFDPEALRSRSASSTAHARTYRSSCSASSSDLAITNSPSLSSSSRARWRATQSHCRQRCEQNSLGRPGPPRSGSTLLHHRHRPGFVMTK